MRPPTVEVSRHAAADRVSSLGAVECGLARPAPFAPHENIGTFSRRPTWLFSSGPLGEDYPEGLGRPENLEALITLTGARDHEVFVGRLDKSDLGLGERLMAKAVKAPEGDFRDWEAIGAWAREIAVGLG